MNIGIHFIFLMRKVNLISLARGGAEVGPGFYRPDGCGQKDEDASLRNSIKLKSKPYIILCMKIGVVGSSGLVGEEVVKLLKKSELFEVVIFSRQSQLRFKGFDLIFLCTPADVSRELAPRAIRDGARVIDLSSAFRKDDDVPLILPAVNGALLEKGPMLMACPNCIVAILLMVLGPLHNAFKVKRMQIVTYQAASGAGKEGLLELMENRPPKVFPHPLANNLFLHESPQMGNGYSEEEDKIICETKKILDAPDIQVNVRSVRVSALRAHSMAVNVTFEQEPEGALEILANSPGIQFHPSPTPKIAEHQEDVFYGSVRKDLSTEKTLDLWIVGDQLLRGAALTAVEIATLSSVFAPL
jgi:aspartate-semialdehyde dehydrogenase